MLYEDRDLMVRDTLIAYNYRITVKQAEFLVDCFLKKVEDERKRISDIVWSSYKGFPEDWSPFGNE